MPPKTQCPSTTLPRLYLCLPNLLSSVSIFTPGPPMIAGWSMKYCVQTSLAKLYRSMAVLLHISASTIIFPTGFWRHECKIHTIFSIGNRLASKNVPDRKVTSLLHTFQGHLQPNCSGLSFLFERCISLPQRGQFFCRAKGLNCWHQFTVDSTSQSSKVAICFRNNDEQGYDLGLSHFPIEGVLQICYTPTKVHIVSNTIIHISW